MSFQFPFISFLPKTLISFEYLSFITTDGFGGDRRIFIVTVWFLECLELNIVGLESGRDF